MNRVFIQPLFFILSATALLQLGGCSAPYKLRADESLQSSNPMHTIAIVGTARVIRPRTGSKEAVLTLAHSKKAVEIAVPRLKKAFEKKGYRVSYAQPVGIGYKWPTNKENWVYTFESKDGKESEGAKYQILDGTPAFEYDATASDPAYRAAVRQEFENMYLLDTKRKIREYTPTKANLETIQKVTGGDTICFMSVWGRQYSAARKAGALALQALGALFGAFGSGGPSDAMSTHVICSQVATGKVLWQNWFAELVDPVEPSEEHFQNVLKLFPKGATQLAHECKFVDKVASLYDCDI